MQKCLLPFVVMSLLSGCRSFVDSPRSDVFGLTDCCGMRPCPNPCDCKTCNCVKPALNALGMAYDGSGSPCYRPPGPFWCWLPGPCSTCRDPWVVYYDTSCKADCIGRHVSYNCDVPVAPAGQVVYVAETPGRALPLSYEEADSDGTSDEEN